MLMREQNSIANVFRLLQDPRGDGELRLCRKQKRARAEEAPGRAARHPRPAQGLGRPPRQRAPHARAHARQAEDRVHLGAGEEKERGEAGGGKGDGTILSAVCTNERAFSFWSRRQQTGLSTVLREHSLFGEGDSKLDCPLSTVHTIESILFLEKAVKGPPCSPHFNARTFKCHCFQTGCTNFIPIYMLTIILVSFSLSD